MLPRDIPIMLVLLSIVIFSSSMFIGDFSDNYGTDFSTGEWNETFNRMSEISADAEGMKESVKPEQGGLDFLFSGTKTVLSLVLNSFATVVEIISGGLQMIGIPTVVAKPVSTGIFAIFTITALFAIISSVLRRPI